MLRLAERALDRAEALFFLDIFRLDDSEISSEGDRDDLIFGRDLPRLLEITVGDNWTYWGITTAFISRENKSTDQSDIISLTLYSRSELYPRSYCFY